MQPFKILGLIAIFSVCTIWGFIKSSDIKKRADKLLDFNRGIAQLAEKLRLGSGEISLLLSQCFCEKLIIPESNGFYIVETYLKKEDISLLREFFENLGMGDSSGEYDRAVAYANLIKEQYDIASKDSAELCKLYKSLGVLSGIFICIFFL